MIRILKTVLKLAFSNCFYIRLKLQFLSIFVQTFDLGNDKDTSTAFRHGV